MRLAAHAYGESVTNPEGQAKGENGLADHPTEERWGDLMRAALDGDTFAYRTLFELLAAALRRQVAATLHRAGSGNLDLDDIVQEALLAVHLKRHSWDPTRPFMPWVRAVTRHKVIDAFRRRRTYIEIDELREVIPAEASKEQDRDDAQRLIGQLSARDQAIVQSISIEDRPPGQVAAELGMSEGALRVALHRALKKLAVLYRRDDR